MCKVCFWGFRSWRGNPRIIAAIAVCILAALFHTVEMGRFAAQTGEDLQVLEPYIFNTSDHAMATLSFLGVILLLADAPFTEQSATYALIRIGRRAWVGGKLLYMLLACVIYALVGMAAAGLWAAPRAFAGNIWSFPFYQISFYGTPTMAFENTAILKSLSPVGAALLAMLLTVLYHFTAGLFLFLLNLTGSRVVGFAFVGAWHCLGYLWAPLKVGVLFGFPHSLLKTHSFSAFWREGNMLGIGESVLMFLLMILTLMICIFHSVRRTDLKITVGETDNE